MGNGTVNGDGTFRWGGIKLIHDEVKSYKKIKAEKYSRDQRPTYVVEFKSGVKVAYTEQSDPNASLTSRNLSWFQSIDYDIETVAKNLDGVYIEGDKKKDDLVIGENINNSYIDVSDDIYSPNDDKIELYGAPSKNNRVQMDDADTAVKYDRDNKEITRMKGFHYGTYIDRSQNGTYFPMKPDDSVYIEQLHDALHK